MRTAIATMLVLGLAVQGLPMPVGFAQPPASESFPTVVRATVDTQVADIRRGVGGKVAYSDADGDADALWLFAAEGYFLPPIRVGLGESGKSGEVDITLSCGGMSQRA